MVQTIKSAETTMTLPVSGMHCGACAIAVDHAIREVPGVSDVSVSFANGSAQVIWRKDLNNNEGQLSTISRRLRSAGYEIPEETIQIVVEGMTSEACAAAISKNLKKLPEVIGAQVSFASGMANISGAFDERSPAAILEAVQRVGYQGQLFISNSNNDSKDKRVRPDFVVYGVLFTAFIFIVDMVIGMTVGHILPPVVQAILASGVQAIAFIRFSRPALHGILSGVGNMDVLVLLGTTAAYSLSLYNLVFTADQNPVLYFEASVVVTAFILVGRWLEARAKSVTRSTLESLRDLQPQRTLVQRNDSEIEINVSDLAIGDLMIVRAGDAIAADGTVESGTSAINIAMVTGESLPEEVGPGAEVYGGAVNGNGGLLVKVSAIGGDTLLGRIIDRVSLAQATAPPVQRIADKVVQVFVPIVMLIAFGTLGSWILLGAAWEIALINAVSVLVIACPCALGLATPITIMVGVGVSARHGILFKDAVSIETASRIDCAVLDKTGTMTEGRPRLIESLTHTDEYTAKDIVRLAASVQAGSTHPLASALRKEADNFKASLFDTSQIETLPGRGVRAVVNGRAFAAGNLPFMQDLQIDHSELSKIDSLDKKYEGTLVHLADIDARRILGTTVFEDHLKPGAIAAVVALTKLKCQPHLVSGDRAPAVASAAESLGISDWRAGVLPNEKADIIAELIAKGCAVAMVGDGINDAPALAQADLGIAVRGGTDVAMETADVVLMREAPSLIPETLSLARKITSKLRENLFWAFAYNVVAIPLAASGFLNPMIAGAAMSLSSLSVVGNALLLRRYRQR